jgi:hypothetical protein
VVHPALHDTRQLVGEPEQVAHALSSHGSHDPSACVNCPNGHDVHSPLVSQVVHPESQDRMHVVAEDEQVAHTVWSQAEQSVPDS